MPSERIQRRIEALLDEADEAVGERDWERVEALVQAVLAIDSENEDAHSYLRIARSLAAAPTDEVSDEAPSESAAEEAPPGDHSVAPAQARTPVPPTSAVPPSRSVNEAASEASDAPRRPTLRSRDAELDHLLARARGEARKSNWVYVESVTGDVLAARPEDTEARKLQTWAREGLNREKLVQKRRNGTNTRKAHPIFAGVASDLAATTGLRVAFVRSIFVLLAVVGGLGGVLYIVLWLGRGSRLAAAAVAATSIIVVLVIAGALAVQDGVGTVVDRPRTSQALDMSRTTVGDYTLDLSLFDFTSLPLGTTDIEVRSLVGRIEIATAGSPVQVTGSWGVMETASYGAADQRLRISVQTPFGSTTVLGALPSQSNPTQTVASGDTPQTSVRRTDPVPRADAQDAFEFASARISEIRQGAPCDSFAVEKVNDRFVQLRLDGYFCDGRYAIVERTAQPEYDGYQFRWGPEQGPPPGSTAVYFTDPNSVPTPSLLSPIPLVPSPRVGAEEPPGVQLPSQFHLVATDSSVASEPGGLLTVTEYLYEEAGHVRSVECQIWSANQSCSGNLTWSIDAVNGALTAAGWQPEDEVLSTYGGETYTDPTVSVLGADSPVAHHSLRVESRFAEILLRGCSAPCFVIQYTTLTVDDADLRAAFRDFGDAASFPTQEQRDAAASSLARQYGQPIVTTILRYVPVFDEQQGGFVFFDDWASQQFGANPANSAFERDPVGATVDLFFDPSPGNIKGLLGLP